MQNVAHFCSWRVMWPNETQAEPRGRKMQNNLRLSGKPDTSTALAQALVLGIGLQSDRSNETPDVMELSLPKALLPQHALLTKAKTKQGRYGPFAVQIRFRLNSV